MNNRIIRTADGRIYRCAGCPYENRVTGFCGFCMRKILGERKMKKMSGYSAMEEEFEEITVLGKPALFTPIRIDRNTVPQGYHYYEIRHDDECQGDAVQIARGIMVNHWGGIIMRDKLKLPPDGYIDIEPNDVSYGAGDCRRVKDFMEKYPAKTKPPKSYER
jgi:hypothetical protein